MGLAALITPTPRKENISVISSFPRNYASLETQETLLKVTLPFGELAQEITALRAPSRDMVFWLRTTLPSY